MEGSGYWIILLIFYLISMWVKKRQRDRQHAREYDTADDGTIEQRSSSTAKPRGDLLSNLLREAGFEMPDAEEEVVFEPEQEPVVYEKPEPVHFDIPPPPPPDHKLETIRERIAEFDRVSEQTALPVDKHNIDWSVRKSSSTSRAYEIRVKRPSLYYPELNDLEDLRDAIILKEILDKPRALQRRIR